MVTGAVVTERIEHSCTHRVPVRVADASVPVLVDAASAFILRI